MCLLALLILNFSGTSPLAPGLSSWICFWTNPSFGSENCTYLLLPIYRRPKWGQDTYLSQHKTCTRKNHISTGWSHFQLWNRATICSNCVHSASTHTMTYANATLSSHLTQNSAHTPQADQRRFQHQLEHSNRLFEHQVGGFQDRTEQQFVERYAMLLFLQ